MRPVGAEVAEVGAGVWVIEAVVAVAGAFIGGVAVLGASRRMIAHYGKTNREETCGSDAAGRGLG